MLSETFNQHVDDLSRRRNLFGDLARIMVSLARRPQPRIGSFTIDDASFISLSNRPLTLRVQVLENEGVPTNIRRSQTYGSSDSYVLDLLAYHDSRLLHQPNSINDEMDGRRQMSVIGLMRTTMMHFINAETRHGPFVFCLTDLHASNIFVDEEWHVTSLIDLEWACSLPSEMLRPPYWLTGENIDRLVDDHFEEFSRILGEFMAEFCAQEKQMTLGDAHSVTMQQSWDVGTFWYFHALESTKGCYNIFKQHLMPRFSPSKEFPDISDYWSGEVSNSIHAKLAEREIYLQQLMLAASSSCPDSHSDADTV